MATPAPPARPPQPFSAPQGRFSPWAIAGFCCALAGIFVAFIGPACAIAFAYLARREIEQDPKVRGAGLASAAMIIGTIMIILNVIGLGLWIAIDVYDA